MSFIVKSTAQLMSMPLPPNLTNRSACGMSSIIKIETNEDFNKQLKGYVNATKLAMNKARALSNYCIEHYHAHGDLGPSQRFHDAMVRNYSRQPAFIKWLADHAPIMMEKGQFIKDKSDNANEFNVAEALKIAFWEYAPEQSVIDFGPDELIAALKATLKKFEGKKYRPIDKAAELELEKLKNIIGGEEAELADAA
jgi:hypothetical protein